MHPTPVVDPNGQHSIVSKLSLVRFETVIMMFDLFTFVPIHSKTIPCYNKPVVE
jgi:hypothetical protein